VNWRLVTSAHQLAPDTAQCTYINRLFVGFTGKYKQRVHCDISHYTTCAHTHNISTLATGITWVVGHRLISILMDHVTVNSLTMRELLHAVKTSSQLFSSKQTAYTSRRPAMKTTNRITIKLYIPSHFALCSFLLQSWCDGGDITANHQCVFTIVMLYTQTNHHYRWHSQCAEYFITNYWHILFIK